MQWQTQSHQKNQKNENNTQEKSMTENNNVGTEEPEQNSTSKN